MISPRRWFISKPVKAIVHRLGSWYWNEVCRREYESQDRKVNERPVEFHFVFDQLSKSSVRSVLDVGTDCQISAHRARLR